MSILKISLLTAAATFLAATQASAAPATNAAPPSVAGKVATDWSAKKIRRSVANENLKAISTKDVAEEPASTVLADAPTAPVEGDGTETVETAKVEVQAAPGAHDDRQPATEEKAATAAPTKAAAHAPSHNSGVDAEKALTWLKNGNSRYLKKQLRTDGKSPADRERLAKGQHPHTVVLSCSDSRVPPETVFDQALGEVFVIRTAGEAIDSAVLASIEYAVEHLGPKLIVVMGHTSCGAVKATIETAEGSSAGSESLDQMIRDIRPRLPARTPAMATSQGLEIESSANAQGVAGDLIKRSAIIRKRVEAGQLMIKPALYHLDSGNVKFY